MWRRRLPAAGSGCGITPPATQDPNPIDVPNPSPDDIIGALRAHDAELRRAGIRHLSLFGSAARGEADAASDIDVVAELDPDSHISPFRLMGLQRRLGEILKRPADLLPEPVENPRLRQNIERDRRRAF
jgi:uncharacterized protein